MTDAFVLKNATRGDASVKLLEMYASSKALIALCLKNK